MTQNYKIGEKILLKNDGANKKNPLVKGPFVVEKIDSPNITIYTIVKWYVMYSYYILDILFLFVTYHVKCYGLNIIVM